MNITPSRWGKQNHHSCPKRGAYKSVSNKRWLHVVFGIHGVVTPSVGTVLNVIYKRANPNGVLLLGGRNCVNSRKETIEIPLRGFSSCLDLWGCEYESLPLSVLKMGITLRV